MIEWIVEYNWRGKYERKLANRVAEAAEEERNSAGKATGSDFSDGLDAMVRMPGHGRISGLNFLWRVSWFAAQAVRPGVWLTEAATAKHKSLESCLLIFASADRCHFFSNRSPAFLSRGHTLSHTALFIGWFFALGSTRTISVASRSKHTHRDKNNSTLICAEPRYTRPSYFRNKFFSENHYKNRTFFPRKKSNKIKKNNEMIGGKCDSLFRSFVLFFSDCKTKLFGVSDVVVNMMYRLSI